MKLTLFLNYSGMFKCTDSELEIWRLVDLELVKLHEFQLPDHGRGEPGHDPGIGSRRQGCQVGPVPRPARAQSTVCQTGLTTALPARLETAGCHEGGRYDLDLLHTVVLVVEQELKHAISKLCSLISFNSFLALYLVVDRNDLIQDFEAGDASLVKFRFRVKVQVIRDGCEEHCHILVGFTVELAGVSALRQVDLSCDYKIVRLRPIYRLSYVLLTNMIG